MSLRSNKLISTFSAKVFGCLLKNYWTVRYEGYRKKYSIDPDFRFNGDGITLYGPGQIILGKNSYIGKLSSIQSSENCVVTIGQNTAISHFVMIYTSNIDATADVNIPRDMLPLVSGNVTIGDNCWIGAGVFIREGITIGPRTIVGAGSVVVKSLPAEVIAGGIPARVIRQRTTKEHNIL